MTQASPPFDSRIPHAPPTLKRSEGVSKLNGSAKYIDDISWPEMLYGLTIRSTEARAKIKAIHFDKKFNWEGFTIVTAKDIPGKNYVALILQDQPFLADTQVNHPDEPVVLLAHADKIMLERARSAVTIEYEALPSLFDMEESLLGQQIIWGKDNVFKSFLMNKGDIDSVWEKADHIVEGVYTTGAQEQLYIEPNGIVASFDSKEGVTVWGSMQCPYYVHKALLPLFNLPAEKIRIVQTETGGGFGGKEEYPSVLAGHAALLAFKSGRPVKMIYDRAEDMAATTKRHPSRTRHKTAVSKDGLILGMDIDFLIDGGAYATLSSVVLSRGTLHAAGPYFIPNVRVHSRAVATNHPPNGAFRGFGAPQSIFALERHLNKIAKVCGLSPEEIRRRNFLKDGQLSASSQLINEGVDMQHLLSRALEESGYASKQAEYTKTNSHRKIKRGIGFATFLHGSGFTGSGEKYLASVVAAELTSEGRVRVLSASTEIGQGTNTIFTQIVSHALGIDATQVEIAQPDTRTVPNSGPTVASRTVMVVGKLVQSAATGIRQTLIQSGFLAANYTSQQFTSAAMSYLKKFGSLKSFAEYKQPAGINWDDEKYQGDAYGTYAWAVYVADVSFDTRTYQTKVEYFLALQEVGKVMHPILAAGQIEGGVAQGIGFALYEKVEFKKGHMVNNQMTNYIMPTSMDLPHIKVLFEEVPYINGPFGAKGIGELPMDGPAPAILNALEMATDYSFNEIPLLPEIVHARLTQTGVSK